MRKEEIINIFEYISSTDKKCAEEFISALSQLFNCIETSLDAAKDQILNATVNNCFEDLAKLGEYCKGLQEIESQLIKCNIALESLEEKQAPDEAETHILTNTPQSTPIKPLPHYGTKQRIQSGYSVDADSSERHTIDEDFEYSRICMLSLAGKQFGVESWKEALLSVCSYLYKKDPKKMIGFVDMPSMNGKKCPYFSFKPVYTSDGTPRNTLIDGSDIYVWTNLSANDKVKLIQKIIRQYGYSDEDVVVYLNAVGMQGSSK